MDLAKGSTLLSGAVYVSLCLTTGCNANAVRPDVAPSRPSTSAGVADTRAYQGSPVTASTAPMAPVMASASSIPRARPTVRTAPVVYQPAMPSARQTGLATEGVPLRADTSSLYDPDGIGVLHFQWQVSDGRGSWSDIPRANAQTYVPLQQDVGRQLRLVVSYVDGQGNQETVITGASNPVFNVNDPPLGSPTISGYAEEDQLLTVDTDGIRDEDGLGGFEVRWEKTLDRHTWRKIDRAVGDRLALDQSDVGYSIRAVVSYTDGQGTREQLYTLPTEAVRNVDDPTRGEIRIVGQAMENHTLDVDVASLADEDGMGEVTVSWQVSHDGKLWRDLSGETGTQVVLSQDYVGQRFRAVGHYRDNYGTDYYLASEATAPVLNLNDAPSGSVRIIGLGDYPLNGTSGSATRVSAPQARRQSRPQPRTKPPVRKAAPVPVAPRASVTSPAPSAEKSPGPASRPVAKPITKPAAPRPAAAPAEVAAPRVEPVKAPVAAPVEPGSGAQTSRVERPAPFLASLSRKTEPEPKSRPSPARPPAPTAPVEAAGPDSVVRPKPGPAAPVVSEPAAPVAVPGPALSAPKTVAPEVVAPPAVAMRAEPRPVTRKPDPLPEAVLLSTLAAVDEDSGPQTVTVSDLVPTAFLKAGGEVTNLQLADPSYGVLRRRTDNTWQYTPALDFNGDAIFRIDTRVPIGGDKVYKAQMPVRSVNDPPTQVRAVLTVNLVEGEGGFLAVGNLLSIFADADGDRLSLISASLRDPQSGELNVERDGRFELRHRGALDASPVVKVQISDGVETVSGVVRLALMAATPPAK